VESNKIIRIFNGATAIVTGGASGMGRTLTEALATRGCEVVLVDLQIELAEEVTSQIFISGGKAKTVKIDMTDFPVMEQMVQETVEHVHPTISRLKRGSKDAKLLAAESPLTHCSSNGPISFAFASGNSRSFTGSRPVMWRQTTSTRFLPSWSVPKTADRGGPPCPYWSCPCR
jgi:hypothetical protein